MEVLGTLKKCIQVLKINEAVGGYSIPVSIYVFLKVIMITNNTFYLITHWENLDDRVAAIRSLAILAACFSFTLSLIYRWNDFSPMLNNLQNLPHHVPYEISWRRKDTCVALYTDMRKFNNTWKAMVVAYWICRILVPISVVIMKTLLFSADFHELIKESSSSPFPIYYPQSVKYFHKDERISDTITYAIAYVLHSGVSIFIGIYAHFLFTASLCAITNVQYELNLLALSFIEMEDLIGQTSGVTEYSLKMFLKYAVKHHQEIHRRFDVVNNGVRWLAFTLCTVASIIICASLYDGIQKDNIILKVQDGIYCFTWITIIFLFESNGERVKTQNENLSVALYESAWVDKPNWFKKSLFIIMTRTCRPLDIKPFGLYGFSLNNFAAVMNAAYCYYNLFLEFKNNT